MIVWSAMLHTIPHIFDPFRRMSRRIKEASDAAHKMGLGKVAMIEG
jgi:hypothetical protein